MENRNVQLEGEMLARRFEGVNKAAFAREYAVPGLDAMIYQNIKGIKPISRKAAVAYAKGFGCSVEEISPYWARELSSTPAEIKKDEKQKAPPAVFENVEEFRPKTRQLSELQMQLVELTDHLDDIGIAILIGHARQIVIQYTTDEQKKQRT